MFSSRNGMAAFHEMEAVQAGPKRERLWGSADDPPTEHAPAATRRRVRSYSLRKTSNRNVRTGLADPVWSITGRLLAGRRGRRDVSKSQGPLPELATRSGHQAPGEARLKRAGG